ncbi:odorant receptor 4-like [Macrosteles quadrilineatus]|uniref:odorant receptor 4-like n=1 Tax=Macrosteles quadrilineatus TaxID=74068 RepID=UPI0023E3082E|nr:odorant receptor 4-like [Macrosteles quadrilineatus]
MTEDTNGWNVPTSKLSQVCLRLTGISTTNYRVFLIRTSLMIMTSVQAIISLCIHWNDGPEEVFRIANDVNAIVYGTSVAITFAYFNKHITDLFSMLHRGLFQYSLPLCQEQHTAKDAAMKRIKRIERIFNISSVLGTVFFFLSPMAFGIATFVTGSKRRLPLPLSPWYPFTIDSIYLYLVLYLFEFSICVTIVIYHISWQTSLYSAIICLQGEMKMLVIAFQRIDGNASVMAARDRVTRPGKAPVLRSIQYYKEQCLKECIQHHQMIIKCVSTLNGAFKITIFEYLQCATFIFCLNAMRLTLEPVAISVHTVTSVGEITPVLLQLFLICFFGQLLRNEDDQVREAFYGCGWPDQTKRFKQMLYIILTRCKKPLCLSGGLYTVDMRTYSQILQAAYSYLNFLLSTHQ